MQTKVVKIDPFQIDENEMKEAAELIRKGELVAFPTETVYGLGADALHPEASHGKPLSGLACRMYLHLVLQSGIRFPQLILMLPGVLAYGLLRSPYRRSSHMVLFHSSRRSS